MARRSPVWLIACALALATGVTLFQLAQLRAAPLPSAAAGTAGLAAVARTVTVRRFYAAANELLLTGETTGFERLLAPSFDEEPARPDAPPGLAGLRQRLARLRAVFPRLRLTPTDLIARDDEVVASVRVDGADRGVFVGQAVPPGWAGWGAVDVFRFAGGRIAAHWNSGAETPRLQPLPRGAVTLSPAAPVLSVQRLTVAAGSRVTWSATRGGTLLVVEAGSLRIGIDSDSAVWRSVVGRVGGDDGATPRPVGPGTTFDLTAGELLRLTDAWFSARNLGTGPATLLTVRAEPTIGAAASLPLGGSGRVAAVAYPAAVVARAPAVALGYADLLPGEAFPTHAAPVAALLWVESGEARLALAQGTGSTSGARAGRVGISPGTERILSADESATLDARSTSRFGNARFDTARVLLVSLDASGGVSRSTPSPSPSPQAATIPSAVHVGPAAW